MKKTKWQVLSVIVIFAILFTAMPMFASAIDGLQGNSTGVPLVSDEDDMHTVTFVVVGGPDVEVDPVQVQDGGLLSEEQLPTEEEMQVEGYELWGLFKDEEGKEWYDFEEDTITEDTTLYICYKKWHVVSFVSNVELGEEYAESLEDRDVLDGMSVPPPEIPSVIWSEDDETEEPDYVFDGMYWDEEFTQRYKAMDPITEDTVLYLHYKPVAGNILINEVHVNIANPVVGNSTDTPILESQNEDGHAYYVWKKQTGLLEVTIPEGENWHPYNGDLGGGMMYGMYLPVEILDEIYEQLGDEYTPDDLWGHLYMQIIIIVENDESYEYEGEHYEPFIGTFERGESYKVYVWLQADDGYSFDTEGVKVFVNDEEIPEDDVMYIEWNEMAFIATLPAVSEYHVLDGDQTFVHGDTEGLTITADGDVDYLVAILVDGEEIDYTDPNVAEVVQGSTILTLKASYLNTLAIGRHTLAYVYKDGQAETTFTIVPPVTPATGDNIKLYITLFAVACVGMVGIMIVSKRLKRRESHR